MNNDIMKDNRYSLLIQLFFYQALYQWKYRPNTRLTTCFPDTLKKYYKDRNANMLKHMRRITVKSLVTQYFVYLYELVEGNFDESLKKGKNDFSKIKFKIDVNGNLKSINSRQLFNIIRQSFAHNDDENLIPHWMWDDNDNVVIHRQLKQAQIEIKIHIDELVSLANIYLTNAIESPRTAVSMYASRISKAIQENRLNPYNVHKYVGSFDIKTKTDIPLDKLQKRALYNFFMKNSKGLDEKTIKMGIHPYDPSLLILKYPFKCNANNSLKDCHKVIEIISSLKDISLTRNNFMHNIFIKKVENGEPTDVIEINDYFGEPSRLEAILANNILFTIFTYMEPSKLKPYISEENDIDLNKLRNSIMHGRFYYNYEGGFEFYDGIIEKKKDGKTLKQIETDIVHIGTITIGEINTITMNLLHDYIDKKVLENNQK